MENVNLGCHHIAGRGVGSSDQLAHLISLKRRRSAPPSCHPRPPLACRSQIRLRGVGPLPLSGPSPPLKSLTSFHMMLLARVGGYFLHNPPKPSWFPEIKHEKPTFCRNPLNFTCHPPNPAKIIKSLSGQLNSQELDHKIFLMRLFKSNQPKENDIAGVAGRSCLTVGSK